MRRKDSPLHQGDVAKQGMGYHPSRRKSLPKRLSGAEMPNIDAQDRAILRALQSDGRRSIQELAERIGLSATPTARRLKKLEDAGIITGYAAILDETKLGFDFAAFVSVKLERQVDNALSDFEAAVRRFPEVVDCWLMTGTRDYLLRVSTTGLVDFEAFLMHKLTKVPSVASIESSIPLRRVKGDASRII
jgi:Lrp/AsnC family leucine-responsive transcriptional regulator